MLFFIIILKSHLYFLFKISYIYQKYKFLETIKDIHFNVRFIINSKQRSIIILKNGFKFYYYFI